MTRVRQMLMDKYSFGIFWDLEILFDAVHQINPCVSVQSVSSVFRNHYYLDEFECGKHTLPSYPQYFTSGTVF
jgi:hypothetical protein